MLLSEKFNTLFQGFSEVHGEFTPNKIQTANSKIKGVPLTKKGGGTPDLWQKHLDGEVGLGIIPLIDDDTLIFSCIDIDEYENFDYAIIEKKVKNLKVPLWIFRSKSGGAHLLLFLEKPLPAKKVIDYTRQTAAALGYGSSEIFPKHHTRSVDTRISNWLNMPYFRSSKGLENCYSPCYQNGKWLTPEEFMSQVWDTRVSEEQFKKLSAAHQKETFPDGPPCLNILAENSFENVSHKNNALLNIAVYYKQAFPESWESKLHVAWSTMFNNSGSQAEINNIIKQVQKKDIKYMCKEAPICDVCNKIACSKKKYGISALGEKGWVLLDGLTRLVDPAGSDPSYIINANGVPITLDSSTQLFNQKEFQRILFDRANVMLILSKNDDWLMRIMGLMENIQDIMMPTEISSEGMMLEYLKEYIDTNSQNVESLEEIQEGRVFIENVLCSSNNTLLQVNACFRSTAFVEFLRSRGFRNAESKKVFGMLKTIQGSKSQKMIKGKNIAYWIINLNKLSGILDNSIRFSDYNFEAPTQYNSTESVTQKEASDTPNTKRNF